MGRAHRKGLIALTITALINRGNNGFEGLCRTTLTDANQIQWYFCDCATAS